MTLIKLLARMDGERFHNIVYSMMEPGALAENVLRSGVEVRTLGMTRGVPDPRALIRLVRGIREWHPAVLQTWMYHADLLGGLAGRLSKNLPVVWNIRHSDLKSGSDKRMTIRIAKICAQLSPTLPDRIVCCAESSRQAHSQLGYKPSKMVVIPNGFDLDSYKPIPDARQLCEQRFGIPAGAEVVSLIARYHPQKDHATFFAAANLFSRDYPNVCFVLCGDGIENDNKELTSLAEKAGVVKNTRLLGRRNATEIALLMSRSALTSSVSRGEGFPNVVGEAMACATICVVTDVGDSAYIVGDCGIVVRPGSPQELAEGWRRVVSMNALERRTMGEAARRRVEQNFRIQTLVSRYENLYSELAAAHD